jgi:hypothetical protein
VVTVRPGDAADTLPAASRARTENVYAVDAASPVAVNDVPDGDPTSVAAPPALERYTSYAVTPTLSVDPAQVSATEDEVTVPAVGWPGTDGA